MATVPRAQLRVGPAAAPNVTLQNPQSADLLSIGARQTQQLGQAMSGMGEGLERLRYEAVEQANALRVDDALNMAQESAIRLQHDPKEGYSQLKGYDALNRGDGVPLPDEYGGKFDKRLGEIESTLGNDKQRQMFRMRANNMRTRFVGEAWGYVDGQQQRYTL
ncbi:MAG: hypothetical protein EOO29_45720, partial [Comamonadaceae bacterium]